MKLWNRILNFLTEDVEEEEIQKIKELPAVEVKPEPVKTETPVQPTEVKSIRYWSTEAGKEGEPVESSGSYFPDFRLPEFQCPALQQFTDRSV